VSTRLRWRPRTQRTRSLPESLASSPYGAGTLSVTMMYIARLDAI
jgi:hypothetical protein